MTQVNRLNRKSYTTSLLLVFAFVFVAYLLDIILYMATGTELESNKYGMPFLLLSVIIGTIYQVMIGVKRLHDIGRSGWELLVAFVPLVGLVIALPMLFRKGTEGNNKYGKSSKGLFILWRD